MLSLYRCIRKRHKIINILPTMSMYTMDTSKMSSNDTKSPIDIELHIDLESVDDMVSLSYARNGMYMYVCIYV